jgi:hypothetical protein
MWDALGIAAGTFNERMLIYINTKLSTTYTELNGAMAALAASVSVSDFGSIGTFDASIVPVLTLIEDGLEEATPFYSYSSTSGGTLRWDFHTNITPPAAGSGDLATGTEAISAGISVFDIDLSPYPGTGYLHFRVSNVAGTSNILTSQQITVPSSWTPADLGANLIGWWKADTGVTESGGAVSQWDDQSGNANHLTQGTGANKPTYSATGFNTSYKGITFDGTNDYLSKTVFTGMSGDVVSIFMAGQLTTGAGSYARAVSYSNTSVDYTGSNNGAWFSRDGTSDALSGYRNGAIGTKAVTLDAPFRGGSVFDGTNHTMYVNNSGGTPVASTGTWASAATIMLGAMAQPGTSDFFKGKIAEIFIFKSAPDSTTRTNIDNYLKARWGL